MCRAVETPPDMIDQLGGWALKSIGNGYGYDLRLLTIFKSTVRWLNETN